MLGGGVSAMITPGKRAMAVKGNAVMGLAGFVRPGDRVDVIVSLEVGRRDDPKTKLVLEKVKVLATGTELTPPDEDGMTASVDVYTLELTPRGKRTAGPVRHPGHPALRLAQRAGRRADPDHRHRRAQDAGFVAAQGQGQPGQEVLHQR